MVLVLIFAKCFAGAEIGVCYGSVADNLPNPREVIELYKQHNIRKMRLYSPNHEALHALQGSDIEVIVGVQNELLKDIAASPAAAQVWVQKNVLDFGHVNFKCIAVGNEIRPEGRKARFLVAAMENIQRAISNAGSPANKIKLSTPIHPTLIEHTYPPSRGSFKTHYRPEFIDPIIKFLVKYQSPLLVHVYPYFAHRDNPRDVRLDYALFESRSNGFTVADNNLSYDNLFDAMLDAHYAALEKMRHNINGAESLKIIVAETGWPSAGGDGRFTTTENARIYNSNLIQHVWRGTPKRPGDAIETYIFAMFKENLKHGKETEKHFGLFFPDKSPVYPISFN